MRGEVRKRRRGYTRISPKLQITIPEESARAAGLAVGDELKVEVSKPGQLIVTRAADSVDALAKIGQELDLHYAPEYLDELRAEWR